MREIFNILIDFTCCMSVDITCGKCGKKITTLKMIKPIKDVMAAYDGKCPSCNQKLSASEFSIDKVEN